MRAAILFLLLLTGCASIDRKESNHITGVAHTDCGTAEGGAIHLTLDANDHFLIVHADGSWGRGWDQGWTIAENSSDFSMLVCDQNARSCTPALKAYFVITSSSESAIGGKITYEAANGSQEFAFQAQRTDANGPIRVCP